MTENKGKRYQDIYPSDALLRSSDVARALGAELLTLEYFEAEPDSMPTQAFEQHHILLNLNPNPHRVENWRAGEHRDFIYQENEVIVTPAGIESGWRWHATSKVIVVTLEPGKLQRFAQSEAGILLTAAQLQDVPQFVDPDLTQAGVLLLNALRAGGAGSAVIFESLARVFLVKLIQRYGVEPDDDFAFSQSFTAAHYQKVLEFVSKNYGQTIALENLAEQAGLSPFHFARVFKKTIGQTPHQFVTSYRIEQAKKRLADPEQTLIDIALSCGFSDQAHFSRTFKQLTEKTPKAWRKSSQGSGPGLARAFFF